MGAAEPTAVKYTATPTTAWYGWHGPTLLPRRHAAFHGLQQHWRVEQPHFTMLPNREHVVRHGHEHTIQLRFTAGTHRFVRPQPAQSLSPPSFKNPWQCQTPARTRAHDQSAPGVY